MAQLIELLAERGAIRIGDDMFDCDAHSDGSIEVGGHTVRPITLAERHHAVSAMSPADGDTSGSSGARSERLAVLIGDVALAPPGQPYIVGAPGGPDVSLRRVLDAIALYLAGAMKTGSLMHTMVLATRSMGSESGASTPARVADEVADALADALRGGAAAPASSTSEGAGWTTIAYGAPADPRTPDDIDAGGLDARAVRHLLAARLLARAETPFDAELAAELIAQPTAVGSTDEPHAPITASASSDGPTNNRGGKRRVDRWGSAVVDPWGPGESAAARTVSAGPGAPAPSPPPSTFEAAQSARWPVASGGFNASEVTSGVQPGPDAAPSMHHDLIPAHSGRSVQPVAPGAVHGRDRAASLAPLLALASESDALRRAALAADPHGPAARPASGRSLARSGPQPTSPGVAPDATARARGGTIAADVTATSAAASPERSGLDMTAAALHRAADLRGVPR